MALIDSWEMVDDGPFSNVLLQQNMVTLVSLSVSGSGNITSSDYYSWMQIMEKVYQIKESCPSFRVIFSLTGNLDCLLVDPDSSIMFFSQLRSLIDLCDGITLDWEWPPTQLINTTTSFLREVKNVLGNKLLNLAVDYSPASTAGYDFSSLGFIDYFEVMEYDMNGCQSSGVSNTSLLSVASQIRSGILSYSQLGIPPTKLIIVFPLYGYAWNNVSPGVNKNGLGQPGTATINYRYSEVLPLTIKNPQNVYYMKDNDSWYYDESTENGLFIQFQSDAAIQDKAIMVKNLGVKGISVWTLNYDTPDLIGLNKFVTAFLSVK